MDAHDEASRAKSTDGRDELTKRLRVLKAGLERRGVTEADAMAYFGSMAGKCRDVQACSCRGHDLGPVPLPAGRMCAREFGERLQDILTKMELVAGKVERCRAYNAQLAAHEVGLGFMDGNEETVRALKRTRAEAGVVETHEKGLYLKLMGERAELLLKWEPIDVDEFHAFCSASIKEMLDISQALKAPHVPLPVKYLDL